jgi:hypothetical protein
LACPPGAGAVTAMARRGAIPVRAGGETEVQKRHRADDSDALLTWEVQWNVERLPQEVKAKATGVEAISHSCFEPTAISPTDKASTREAREVYNPGYARTE